MEQSVKELLEALKEKRELVKDIEKLWKEGGAEKVVDFLGKSGIKTDVETIEKVLAESQKYAAEKIKNGEIDDKQLGAVTGGKYCEGYFREIDWSYECHLIVYCDLHFWCE